MPAYYDEDSYEEEYEEYEEVGDGLPEEGGGATKASGIPKNKEELAERAKAMAENKALENEQVAHAKETADRSRKLAEQAHRGALLTQKGVTALGSTLANPVFWIAMVVILFILLIIALSQTVGKNENAKGCGGNTGGGAGVPSGPYDLQKNMDGLGTWLMSTPFKFNGNKPLSKEQAAGMIGNWMEESHLDPAISQGGHPGKQDGWCKDQCTPEVILALPDSAEGKAIGLAQWDKTRRTALVKFAQSKGKQWQDLSVQVEYLKSELDGGEGKSLAKSEFVQPGLTPARYAQIFNRTFERSSDFSAKRGVYADEVMTKMKGGGTIDSSGNVSGGSCTMGGDFDASGVVQLAISLAYPLDQKQKAFTSPGDADGCAAVTPAYKAAKEQAQKKAGEDSYSEGGPCKELYASCDRFVATVLKLTVDPEIPWGSSDTQHDYFPKHPDKWQAFHTKAEAKPGAVFTTYGHIMLYVGKVNGVDAIAQASHKQYVARIDKSTYISDNLVDTGGRKYVGYNFIGSGGSGADVQAVSTSQASAPAK